MQTMVEKFGKDIKLKSLKEYNISDMVFRVEKIKRSIESIGPINWAVKDEHEEKSARLNNLLNQKSDLIDAENNLKEAIKKIDNCLLYTSPSPRDVEESRMPSSA